MNNLVYGFHSVSPLIWQNPSAIEVIYLDNKRNDKRSNDIKLAADEAGVVIELVSSVKLDKISATNKHQGVVAVLVEQIAKKDLSLKAVLAELCEKDNSIIMVLDGITDPHNLGAIIRSCDCFGVDAIVIPKDNSASINPTVAKVSSGAINHVAVVVVNNLARSLEEIKDQGYWIAGTTLAESSISLFDFKPDKKMAWVLGSECDGIRRLVAENCDYLVSIPMYGNTQSLNVSVAAGVVLSYNRYAQK
jgi:23S rRNA (guanosine2251-2'-O)-methyltransferase